MVHSDPKAVPQDLSPAFVFFKFICQVFHSQQHLAQPCLLPTQRLLVVSPCRAALLVPSHLGIPVASHTGPLGEGQSDWRNLGGGINLGERRASRIPRKEDQVRHLFGSQGQEPDLFVLPKVEPPEPNLTPLCPPKLAPRTGLRSSAFPSRAENRVRLSPGLPRIPPLRICGCPSPPSPSSSPTLDSPRAPSPLGRAAPSQAL